MFRLARARRRRSASVTQPVYHASTSLAAWAVRVPLRQPLVEGEEAVGRFKAASVKGLAPARQTVLSADAG
jgi:hypothetical protein